MTKRALDDTLLPMQPVIVDDHGRVRFRRNKLVEYLLDHGRIDMNQLANVEFPREDREQFAQLIGYSIAGYHELSYVSDESAALASARAREVMPESGGCRDTGCEIHGGPIKPPAKVLVLVFLVDGTLEDKIAASAMDEL